MSAHRGGKKRDNKKMGRGHNKKNARYYTKIAAGLANDGRGNWIPIRDLGTSSGKRDRYFEYLVEELEFRKSRNLRARQRKNIFGNSRAHHA